MTPFSKKMLDIMCESDWPERPEAWPEDAINAALESERDQWKQRAEEAEAKLHEAYAAIGETDNALIGVRTELLRQRERLLTETQSGLRTAEKLAATKMELDKTKGDVEFMCAMYNSAKDELDRLESIADVVCADHWHGLYGESVSGSTGCPWCLALERENDRTDAEQQLATLKQTLAGLAELAEDLPTWRNLGKLQDAVIAAAEGEK